MTGALFGLLLVALFAFGPILAVGRLEGDEREPIRLHLGGWRNGSR
jgi:hypothetical protein